MKTGDGDDDDDKKEKEDEGEFDSWSANSLGDS